MCSTNSALVVSSDHTRFFEAEIAWPTVERLTDNNMIELLICKIPASCVSLRVGRISASLGEESPVVRHAALLATRVQAKLISGDEAPK